MKNRARKIKILILDPKNNFKLGLPAIHFGFLSFLGSTALFFKPLLLKNRNLERESIDAIKAIDKDMIREILNELKSYGPFDLVDISTGDGTRVKISTL